MVGWLNTLITYLPISHKMCLKANGNILHSGAHGKACSKRMQKERQKAALLRNIVQGHGWKCDPYRKWESNQSGIHLSCPWRSLLNIKITYMKYTINHRAIVYKHLQYHDFSLWKVRCYLKPINKIDQKSYEFTIPYLHNVIAIKCI